MSTYLLQAKSRSKTAQYLAHDGTLTPEVAHAATSWGLDDAMKVIHFAKLFGKDGLEQLVPHMAFSPVRVFASRETGARLFPVEYKNPYRRDDEKDAAPSLSPMPSLQLRAFQELLGALAPCMPDKEYTLPGYARALIQSMALTPMKGVVSRLVTVYCPQQTKPGRLVGGKLIMGWRSTAQIHQVFHLTGVLEPLQPPAIDGFDAYVAGVGRESEEPVFKFR